MAEIADARAPRFAELASLIAFGVECEPLTAAEELVAAVRGNAEAERFSGAIVAETDAASKPKALHEPGIGGFVICRCGAGVFGIGLFGIGMPCRFWQQACKFTAWQWTPHAAATAGVAVHRTIMARAAHGRPGTITDCHRRRAARTPGYAERGEENIDSVYVF